MTDYSWLTSLKKGDKVATHNRYHGYKIITVVRTTKTQIHTDDQNKWNRKGGHPIPFSYTAQIEEVTLEVREAVRRQRALRNVVKTKWDDVSTETLEDVVLLLAKERAVKK